MQIDGGSDARGPGARDALVVAAGLAGCAALWHRVSPTAAVVFAAAVALAWILVPPVARLVSRRGWDGLPGGRAAHARRTPLLGGVSIFLPFFAATVVLAAWGDAKAFGLAAGAVVLLVCGVYDDLKGVRPRVKVVAQVAAGACLVVAGFRLPSRL